MRAELQEMWNCETIEDARKKRDEIIADYRDVAESDMSCLDEGFEIAMTVMALPKTLRRYFRTSNDGQGGYAGGKVSGLGEAGAEGADRGAQGGAGDVRRPARGHAAAAGGREPGDCTPDL